MIHGPSTLRIDITVHGNVGQMRLFCYVADTITAILLAATRKQMKGEVVNIDNPHEISILDLAKKINTLTNSNLGITFHPRPADDPQRRCPDISKAKRLLGWCPMYRLRRG
jgi:nucleoside-diphosphate-sugar epimerase